MARENKAGGGTSRRRRGSLSEAEILGAALLVVERDGLAGLSMPVLARHLGAGVMSIYWYFRNKDELLMAMADRAFEEVYSDLPGPGDGPWEEELVGLYTALFKALQRAPLYLQLCQANPALLVPRAAVVPALGRRLEGEIELLRRIGLSAAEALRIHSVLSSYTLGMMLMQLGRPSGDTGPTPEDAVRASLTKLDADKYPTLLAVNDPGAIISVGDTAFVASLQLFVAGLTATYTAA